MDTHCENLNGIYNHSKLKVTHIAYISNRNRQTKTTKASKIRTENVREETINRKTVEKTGKGCTPVFNLYKNFSIPIYAKSSHQTGS